MHLSTTDGGVASRARQTQFISGQNMANERCLVTGLGLRYGYGVCAYSLFFLVRHGLMKSAFLSTARKRKYNAVVMTSHW